MRDHQQIFAEALGEPEPILTRAELAAIQSRPDAVAVYEGFCLMAEEISAIFESRQVGPSLIFGFHKSRNFGAFSSRTLAREHVIGFNTGLFSRLVALFRQLSLTNAFGKYSQVKDLDRDTLVMLRSLPDIDSFRHQEEQVPVDALLNAADAARLDEHTLASLLARPPVDDKHLFDLQTLATPALAFAFWHELAHILYGHLEWLYDSAGLLSLSEGMALAGEGGGPEEKKRYRLQRGLEYMADEFAARRVATDILRSANVEKGRYVLGPFWFDRSGFEFFGKQEGLPGEQIEFNLEGYLYRLAFAMIGLVLQFEGFFREPYTDRLDRHPHAEVRLSRIVDAVWHQLCGPTGPHFQTYVADLWSKAFGFAIHTFELGLAACGARRLPLATFRRFMGGTFHDLEIQAKVKVAHQDIEQAKAATKRFRQDPVLEVLEPQRNIHRSLPLKRFCMIEMKANAGLPMYQGSMPERAQVRSGSSQIRKSEGDQVEEVMETLMVLARATSQQERLAAIEANRQILLNDIADMALGMWISAVSQNEGHDSAAVRHLNSCRQLLELCRKKGVKAARGTDPQLLSVLSSVISAGTWSKCRQIIEENCDIMLTGRIDPAMDLLIAQATADPDLVKELEEHRELLRQCQVVGVDRAFAEVGQLSGAICRSRNIVDAVMAFVNADTWDESQEIVERNRDLLLTNDADEAFMQLITLNQASPQAVETLIEHRALLADCRRRGIGRAFRDV